MPQAPFRHRKLGYVALNVTDLGRTTDFALNLIGLWDNGRGPSGEQFLACSNEHHDLVLYQAREPGFVRAGWELETPDDVERAYSHYEGLGLRPTRLAQEEKDILGLGVWPAFRMRDPIVGMCFEYYAKMMVLSRVRPTSFTKFKCIGHFGVNTPNVREAVDYAVANMNIAVSDVLGDYVGARRMGRSS
jgi:2,3-dihydroxy-p-cumate/2,3-dihydroxybenzoate 3,4-dioxygenase